MLGFELMRIVEISGPFSAFRVASKRMNEIIRRIGREAGVPNLTEIMVERIEPSDLQSLLMEVYEGLVRRRNPRIVFSDYVSNRFTRPFGVTLFSSLNGIELLSLIYRRVSKRLSFLPCVL